jgi:outer membrane protein TolC
MRAQQLLTLDLNRTITLANDSSLESFRTQNMYLSGYWAYRTYRANRLPSLSLNLTPAQYNRDIIKRYDSNQDLDVYRTQQSFYADGGLSLRQNIDLTGGTVYMESSLTYMRNFGDASVTQFTSVPIRIGYSQSLVGYNSFRWDRKIEPLKYERAKKEFLYNVEQVSETAANYFFSLAMAQAEYDLAKENLASTDTLYRIGMQRQKIMSISKADLLTLNLDRVNAQNTLQNRMSDLKRAMFSLASFLNIDKDTHIRLELPSRPRAMEISMDEALQWGRNNNPQLLALKQNVLEAQREVDRTKKESRFNASVNASIGFNQMADNFGDVYHRPMQQDLVSVGISIPLVDLGVRKGRYNMARNNLNVVEISSRQSEVSIEEEVIMTVNDFNIQQQLIASAEEALDLSIMAYNETRQRFMIGQTDISSLTLSRNRQQEAQRNYISALQNYWLNYYKIRRLTLFDFAAKLPLSERFDFNGGNLMQ